MLISYNWLKQHLNQPFSFSAEEVGKKLKASTVEVEGVSSLMKDLAQVVVGEILEIKNHPNADKLHVAQVDVGEGKPRQVIFGEMVKMEVGNKVPVALAPALLPGNKKIDRIELRGVLTEGMLCLDQELGLLKEGVSIHFFAQEVKNGASLIEALKLDDFILEIDNKSLSHRPDLWSHYGIAREVSALFGRDLNEYKTGKIKEGKSPAMQIEVSVKDVKLCPRYMAVAVSGVKVAGSPDWLKQSLMSVGVRPINNVVDITNFVMLDLGQPMHAFSADALNQKAALQSGNTNIKNQKFINVRSAHENEKIVALDGEEYLLNANDLVIADDEKAIAIAGVMGGEGSSVTDSTETIIFESANFNPSSVRKTSNRLGLRTDSAMRFEKSLDPTMCETALRKAVQMLQEFCPEAKVASKVVDAKEYVLAVGPIEVNKNDFRKKLGVEIEDKKIADILSKLGFEVKSKKDALAVKIPTWRATKDVSIAEDLIEEVARIFGYDNIPAYLPSFTIFPPERNILRILERKIKNILAKEMGFTEVYNYSFVSGQQIQKLGDDISKYIELDNPISKEKPYLRRNLLPNLLENLTNNIARYPEVKIFEIGKTFNTDETGVRARANRDELLPRQDSWLTVAYANKKDGTPFFQVKRAAETIFSLLNLRWENAMLDKVLPWEHPARVAMFSCAGSVVGVFHELHPSISEKHGIDCRVGILRMNLDALAGVLDKAPVATIYQPISVYPEVTRDVAFLVKREISHGEVLAVLQDIDPILKKVELFDVFEGKNIAAGYKSMAYRLTYLNTERTLTTEEVDVTQEKVIGLLREKFGAEVRK